MKEISLHVLDIVQNSIAAGANLIKIKIIENIALDELIIEVEDNGHGMDKDTCKKVSNPFFTSRTTRKVGLGIPLFMAAAERCGGSFKIDSTIGVGTKIIANFIFSHIDRAPLGNMYDTIAGLIICNKDIDFKYTHVVNNNKFEFDTKQIKDMLKEVPIDSPEVMGWMRDYLKEGIESLYGGVNNENNSGIGRNKEEDSSNN